MGSTPPVVYVSYPLVRKAGGRPTTARACRVPAPRRRISALLCGIEWGYGAVLAHFGGRMKPLALAAFLLLGLRPSASTERPLAPQAVVRGSLLLVAAAAQGTIVVQYAAQQLCRTSHRPCRAPCNDSIDVNVHNPARDPVLL